MTLSMIIVQGLIASSVVLASLALRRIVIEFENQFTTSMRSSLEDMFVFIDPLKIFQLTLIFLVIFSALAWLILGAWPLVLLVALVSAALPFAVCKLLRHKRRQQLQNQMPDALAMLAASLRSGASFQMSLSMVVTESPAPLAQEFSLVLREYRLGLSFEKSLKGMGQRLDSEDMALFVSAVMIAKEVGGNLAEILDSLAQTLRTKATMEGKIRALTAQGKMQGWVVGLLPVALGLVLYAMDPEAMSPLFTTGYGWIVLGIITLLLGLGAFFIRKVVSIDL